MSKKILGLDLGTNSIGWALVENESIKGIGSRIIPMGAEVLNFEKGNPQTKNADRRSARSIRRMGKRYKARRNKLLYALQELAMLPAQFQFSMPFKDPSKIQKINLLPVRKGSEQLTGKMFLELKVKALSEKIELADLGKLIFNYNQLRGYAGGSNEDEKEETKEDPSENEETDFLKYEKIIQQVKVISEPVLQTSKKKGKEVYNIEVGWDNETLQGETILNTLAKGTELELQIIIRRDKLGKTTSVNFSLPVKTNWRKAMEELEEELDKLTNTKGSEAFLSEYFLEKINNDKNYRIRNKVVLRKRYQAEFDKIWETQSNYYSFLNNTSFEQLDKIANFIFPGKSDSQIKLRQAALDKGLKHLIRNQIIYFQRELKDQSDLIGFCRYEKDQKVVPKSHPVFQEFKIWEQINKLSINTKTQTGTKKNGEPKFAYSDVLLSAELKQYLFDELNKKKEVSGNGLYAKLEKEGIIIKNKSFLNGIYKDAKLKGNETLIFLKKQLGEWFEKLKLDNPKKLISFWDILYYSKGNEYDLNSDRCQTIKNYIIENYGAVENSEKLIIRFAKIKFARNYGSLSLKAIENILPLMRAGKYFESELPKSIHDAIVKVINEKQEDPFLKSLQDHLEQNQEALLVNGGMMSSYATILIYGKHTAESFTGDNIKTYYDIKPIPIGQLRNPLAEQIINETLKMVKEIWKMEGEKPDEIRVELARELKNSLDERKKITEANDKNRKTNERVKQRLIELNKETSLGNIERYKLWTMQSTEPFPAPTSAKQPTKAEIEKMRLWEEQKCISPYTGQPIPLSKLFDKGQYDIDHIIPKSRYFDDSLTNKVVCERSVNIDKGNRTAWEYFEVGSITESLLSKDNFTNLVNERFYGRKRKNLLATKIPQDPVARQLKDTQYIATRVREELSKIIGSDNVKTTTGGVTDYLRHHWGLTNKLKEITNDRIEKARLLVSEEKRNDIKWSKRIDHRHHAMDALTVACTEQSHILRLNNLNKALQDWLKIHKDEFLKDFEGSDEELMEEFVNMTNDRRKDIWDKLKGFRNFDLPWKGFPDEAKKALESIIVSHKPKEKLLIQKVQKGKDAGEKDMLRIRGKLHDATLYGMSQGKEAYKIKLTKLAGKQFATEKTIEKIIDPLIKTAIKNHFELKYKKNKTEAFSAEGINELNKDRKVPIYGFKIYYKDQSENYKLSKLGNKKIKDPAFNEILDRIIDEEIKKEIISHIDKKGDFKEAFSKEGLEEFNKHLEEDFIKKNDGNKFKPISSIKLKATETEEEQEMDLSLLQLTRSSSYNKKLFVSTGSNYAFAILEKEGKRHYDEISLFHATNLVNDALKIGNKNINLIIGNYFEERNPTSKVLFLLKQNDIVYLPRKEETVILDPSNPDYEKFWNDKYYRAKNIYAVVKFSGKQIYFLKHDIANVILNKIEFGSQNCYEKVDGVSIKDSCIKVNIDRIGNLSPVES
ncbi:MAG: HNH endonuclease domain-containing protein [Bacteroidota bacterium]|nr:HNH endonuclease domain-containing protein [Bacteroidota bacterium]